MSAPRRPLIDALRGLAAVWVVLFHLDAVNAGSANGWRTFCQQGWLGVSVFFVISGYCIAAIASKETRVTAFLAARFARIYLPYWASLAVVLGVIAIRYLWTGVNDVSVLPNDFLSWIATLALATAPASNIPTVNWVYWSLTYEVAFYLIVALGIVLRRPTHVVGGTTLVAACWAWAMSDPLPQGLFFLRHFPLFALGWSVWENRRSRLAVPLFALAFGAACLSHARAELLAGSIGLLLLLIHGSSLPVRAVAWCGQFSYSLYLIHVPIGCYLLARQRSAITAGDVAGEIGHDVAILTLVAVFAWLMFRLVEKPAHEWGRRIALNLRLKNTPALSPVLGR